MLANKFQLVRELGRGAFGVVYEAKDTYLDRTVAIKTIRDEVFTSDDVQQSFEQRFLREARSVARLSHPHIITVYEAGKDGGTSYIAMEFVRGRTLRDVLRERGRLSYLEAVKVAEGLLSALDYAHTQGIVHRDIKPENVMIRDDGVLKVADFGIAKALHAGSTNLTRDGAVLGTPAYMAPEQVMGKPVDGRTDVFSAAALLYEVLAGGKPFDAPTMPGLVHQVLTAAPPSLMTRAQVPAAAVAAIDRALQKSPDERFPTAGDFLEAFRGGAAAPPAPPPASTPTRATDRQAMPTIMVAPMPSAPPRLPAAEAEPRAGRGLIVAGVVMALLLGLAVIVGGVVAALYYIGKSQREAEWQRHSTDAETAYRKGDYATSVREAQAALAIAERFGDSDPRLWRTLNDVGKAYYASKDYAHAEGMYKRALEVREHVLSPSHPDIAGNLDDVAQVLEDELKYPEAETYFERALAIREKQLGPESLEVAHDLMGIGWCLFSQHRSADGEKSYRRALAIREKKLAADDLDVAWALDAVAMTLADQSKYADAEPFARRCLQIRSRKLGPESLDLARADYLLGLSLMNIDRNAEAEGYMRQALTIRDKVLGPRDVLVAWACYELGNALFNQKKFTEAEPILRRALAIREAVLPADDTDVGFALHDLASTYGNLGRNAEAEPMYRRALTIFEAKLGADSLFVALTLHNMGVTYNNLRRWADAETVLKRALTMRAKLLGATSPVTGSTVQAYAFTLRQTGREADAQRLEAWAKGGTVASAPAPAPGAPASMPMP